MYADGKKIVSEALATIPDVKVTGSYKTGMKSLPCIIYKELVNTKASKGPELRTNLAYSIDIYSESSTTSLASQVDDKILALGFKRGQCLDLDDPSGLRHKNMKYTGVYDWMTNRIYEE